MVNIPSRGREKYIIIFECKILELTSGLCPKTLPILVTHNLSKHFYLDFVYSFLNTESWNNTKKENKSDDSAMNVSIPNNSVYRYSDGMSTAYCLRLFLPFNWIQVVSNNVSSYHTTGTSVNDIGMTKGLKCMWILSKGLKVWIKNAYQTESQIKCWETG